MASTSGLACGDHAHEEGEGLLEEKMGENSTDDDGECPHRSDEDCFGEGATSCQPSYVQVEAHLLGHEIEDLS